MRLIAVCILFLLRLKWSKNKSSYERGITLEIRPILGLNGSYPVSSLDTHH
jgi:hypothetical protein